MEKKENSELGDYALLQFTLPCWVFGPTDINCSLKVKNLRYSVFLDGTGAEVMGSWKFSETRSELK